MWDGGATHYVHENDDGAIAGTWKKDVPGLHLGDDSWLPAFGSVEKDFIPPASVGGPDIRRRVLIAPGVATRIWSHPLEVDHYKSTLVDGPDGKYVQLVDGRLLPLCRSENGLRWLALPVRSTSFALSPTVFAATHRPSDPHANRGVLARITGVGKRTVLLTPLHALRLWHCILGHPSTRRLLETIRNTLAILGMPKLTPDAIAAFNAEHCDICDAFRQRRNARPTHGPHPPRAPVDDDVENATNADVPPPPPFVPPTRSLQPMWRVIMDVFGPVKWASAQHGFQYVVGYCCECTGMRWVFGLKTHTEPDVE